MADNNNNDDDDKVGRGNPPKKYRFKPGTSGNPSGGWDKRRARAAAKKKAAEEKAREDERSTLQKIRDILKTKHAVIVDGERQELDTIEIAVMKAVRDLKAGDEKAGEKILRIAKQAGLLTPEPEKPTQHVGVVVVRQPARSIEEWAARTRAIRVPLDPLEGIPGYDQDAKTLNGQPFSTRRKPSIKEDDED